MQTRPLGKLQPGIGHRSWLLGDAAYRRRLVSTASGGEKEQKKGEDVAIGGALSQSTGTRFEDAEDNKNGTTTGTPPVEKASLLQPVSQGCCWVGTDCVEYAGEGGGIVVIGTV